MVTHLNSGLAGSVATNLRRDARRRRGESIREVAARELRAELEHYVDTHPEAGLYLSDVGARSQAWFDGSHLVAVSSHSKIDCPGGGIVLRARSLVELDDSVSSSSIAFWATWLSGSRAVAVRALHAARTNHGTDGSAAVLGLTDALVAHMGGDLRRAMEIYPMVHLSRIGVFRRAAIVSAIALMTQADDPHAARVWLDRARDEDPVAIAGAFQRLLQRRRERDGPQRASELARSLAMTLDSVGLDPAFLDPVLDCR